MIPRQTILEMLDKKFLTLQKQKGEASLINVFFKYFRHCQMRDAICSTVLIKFHHKNTKEDLSQHPKEEIKHKFVLFFLLCWISRAVSLKDS